MLYELATTTVAGSHKRIRPSNCLWQTKQAAVCCSRSRTNKQSMVRTHRPASHFVGTCIVMHGWFRSVIGAGTDVVAVPAHPKALHCKCTIHRPGCIMRTDVRPVRGPDCVCVWRCHGASTCKKFTGRRYVLATRHQYPLPAATHVRVTGADGMHACSRWLYRQAGRYLDRSENCVYILDPIQAARRDERDPRG